MQGRPVAPDIADIKHRHRLIRRLSFVKVVALIPTPALLKLVNTIVNERANAADANDRARCNHLISGEVVGPNPDSFPVICQSRALHKHGKSGIGPHHERAG